MAGYSDTRQLIIDTLMGRPAGTEIQPEDHQAFALALNDYIRSVELVAGSGVPVAFAEPDTVPVQPNNGQAVYLSYVPRSTTKDFVNFIKQSGNSISVTSSSGEVKLVTLLWNGSYWSSQIVTIDVLSDDSNVNTSNIGASDYILFSASSNYSIGDIVRYDGKLYKFTAEHVAGAWIGTDAKLASINSILTSKLTELKSESNTLYFEQGSIDGNEEIENTSISRSCFIAVKKGDVVRASIFRIKKYNKYQMYYGEDFTSIQLEEVVEADYTVTDEECKFIRILSRYGHETPIYVNGENYLPYIAPNSHVTSYCALYPYKPFSLDTLRGLSPNDEAYKREAVNGAILGIWIKNPDANSTYHLTQFRYRQISPSWDNTEYTAIYITKKSSSIEVRDTIVEDRTSATINDDIQIYDTENYLVIVDWSKAVNGFGFADDAGEKNQLDDITLTKNNTIFLSCIRNSMVVANNDDIGSLYYEHGNVHSGGQEADSPYLSRSEYIAVNTGDVVSSWIYRVKMYDKDMKWLAEGLTTSEGGELKYFTIENESCAFVRLVCKRGEEHPIYVNGENIIPLQIASALNITDYVGGMYPLKAFNIRNVDNYTATGSLLFRDYINNSILGLWIKNPTPNTSYYLTAFRYRQISPSWDNTEYTQLRITEKSSDGSVKNITIVEDRTSATINDDVQVFDAADYTLIVDWSKAQKGSGNAESVNDCLLLDDVITQKNNTSFLTLLELLMPPTKIIAEGVSFEENENGVISMPLASASTLGFMSSSDKRKLDTLQQGDIIIQGSGIAKNASAFGFLPTNDGTTNANNLQNCVNGGGLIIIDLIGSYNLSKSILLDSNTKLVFGKGVEISLVEENGSAPAYPFINRGALSQEYNENITIEGLHIVTNGIQGNDITTLPGQRGYIAMKRIKNLTLKDIEVLDVPRGWYTIHIQQFYNINLEHIHIEGMKDGIHLGVGKKFRIAHCLFKTNDDSIALNAHDYPSGTSEFGWIEDGIIEDITILPTPSGNLSRGVYALGGAWADWKDGNSYQPLGDACVSNNGVYVTMGVQSTQQIVSTQQPNHASGKKTYSDGLTWIRLDNLSAQYDAGVRNITVRDLHIASFGRVATFNLDRGEYSNSLYEGCAAPVFENITFENVRQDKFAADSVFVTWVPFSNLRLNNFDLKVGFRGISTEKLEEDTYSGKCSLLISGMALYQNSEVFIKNDRGQRNIDLKMIGTMIIHNPTLLPTIYGSSTVNFVSDIELGEE